MRRDVFIENDSGGFSVLAADAVDDIIQDGRGDDYRFVAAHKAMLIMLVGDDSMPVRIVVDEPLTADEESQWLARATWRIDTSDGRMLVMGGFDPDVLSWWKEESGAADDGRGIGVFSARPGSWRVDVYAHVGSMNGRAILNGRIGEPGAAFRRAHPGRAFPLWLAKMLEYSRDEDPGFDEAWRDIPSSMASGALAIDTSQDAIGFLVHVMPLVDSVGEPPESGWFDTDTNARVPTTFPLGLRSEVPDVELEHFRDRILGRETPEPELPIADRVVEIIEVWSGDPLKSIEGGPVAIRIDELFILHWMAALTADSPPRFEVWIEPKGAWTPPAATTDYAVVPKGRSTTAIGPVANSGGWHLWWTARSVAGALKDVPDGSTIDFATAPRLDDRDDDRNPAVGRALYSGTTRGNALLVADASPRVSSAQLGEALAFVRRLVERTKEEDERDVLIDAADPFRARFADVWPVDVDDDD